MQSTCQTAVDKCVMVCTTDLLINYIFKMKRRKHAPRSALYKFNLSDNKELRFIACFYSCYYAEHFVACCITTETSATAKIRHVEIEPEFHHMLVWLSV